MSNDSWATPKAIYRALDKEFNFAADMAASHENAHHEIYWTEEENSLDIHWHDHVSSGYVYCNPPYSNIGPWIDKAIHSQTHGLGTVMLVMADPSVKWFAKAAEYATEIRFVTKGRIAFLENGKPKSGNNKGSVFLIFAPKMIGTGKVTFVTRQSLLDAGKEPVITPVDNYGLAA